MKNETQSLDFRSAAAKHKPNGSDGCFAEEDKMNQRKLFGVDQPTTGQTPRRDGGGLSTAASLSACRTRRGSAVAGIAANDRCRAGRRETGSS